MENIISEEQMKEIRAKAQKITVEHEGLSVTAYIYNNMIYVDDAERKIEE